MRLHFLGTGTSFGIPVIGCDCATCTSADPRDRRTRHAALVVGDDGRRLLVDTPPELRLQLLAAGIGNVDALWFTHCHADHIHGIDDVRAFTAHRDSPIAAYAGPDCADVLRLRFSYIFDADYEPAGSTKPHITLEPLDPDRDVEIAGMRLTPLPVPHGAITAFGFRVGQLGYITDAKALPGYVVDRLRGVRTLVLNALWFGHPHPSHFTIDEAAEAAASVGAQRTYLTHLTHRVRHAQLLDVLPRGIEPAYDGLVLDF